MKQAKLLYLTCCILFSGCSKDDESITFNIEDQEFSVSENVANAEIIGTINAELEESAEATFSIVSGNEDEVFALSSNGELSVQNNLLLDFETISSYNLIVEIEDADLSDQATITINVTDGPENVSTMEGKIRFENKRYDIDEGVYFEEIDIMVGTEITTEVTNNYRLINGDVSFGMDEQLVTSNSSIQFAFSTTEINPESRAQGTFTFGAESEIEIMAGLLVDGNANGTLLDTEDDLENDKVFFATGGTVKLEDVDGDPETLDFAIEVDVVISEVEFNDEFDEDNFEDFIIDGTETTLKFNFTKTFVLFEDDDSEPVEGRL